MRFPPDAIIIDRLFQPIANYIHEKIGLTPSWIAQIFCISATVLMAARYYFIHGKFDSLLILDLSYPLVFSAGVIIWPTRSSDARNTKRRDFVFFRIGLLLLSLYFVIVWFVYIVLAGGHWYETLYTLATVFLWIGVCFDSVDNPPPRRFQSARNWNLSGGA